MFHWILNDIAKSKVSSQEKINSATWVMDILKSMQEMYERNNVTLCVKMFLKSFVGTEVPRFINDISLEERMSVGKMCIWFQ